MSSGLCVSCFLLRVARDQDARGRRLPPARKERPQAVIYALIWSQAQTINQWAEGTQVRWSAPTCSFSLGELGRCQLQLQTAAHLDNRRPVQTPTQNIHSFRSPADLVGVDGHWDDAGRVEDAPPFGRRLPGAGLSHLRGGAVPRLFKVTSNYPDWWREEAGENEPSCLLLLLGPFSSVITHKVQHLNLKDNCLCSEVIYKSACERRSFKIGTKTNYKGHFLSISVAFVCPVTPELTASSHPTRFQ